MWQSKTMITTPKDTLKFKYSPLQKNRIFEYYDEQNIVALHIFKSGWSNPQMYICVLEWGEWGDVDHHLYSAEEIKKQFGISTFSRLEKLKAIAKISSL